MYLILSNGDKFSLNLQDCFTKDIVTRWFKHLQHVDIPWRPWEYLKWIEISSWDYITETIIRLGSQVDIKVQPDQLNDQTYLNFLHQLYEKGYNGQQKWTDYHELIHVVESKQSTAQNARCTRPVLGINYRHLAGPLKIKFQYKWLDLCKPKVKKGTIYLAWDELGKTPYSYFSDQEPNDLWRFVELSKPWIWLRPKLHIAVDDIDFIPVSFISEWDAWYKDKHDVFCQHYQLPHWSLSDMYSVLPIGHIPDIDQLESSVINGNRPQRIIVDKPVKIL